MHRFTLTTVPDGVFPTPEGLAKLAAETGRHNTALDGAAAALAAAMEQPVIGPAATPPPPPPPGQPPGYVPIWKRPKP